MQERAAGEHAGAHGDALKGGEDRGERRIVPARTAGVRVAGEVLEGGLAAQGAADFAVEVEALAEDALAHAGLPFGKGMKGVEQRGGGGAVEVRDADVENRLAVSVDGAHGGLLGERGLLEVEAQAALAVHAKHAVARSFFRGGPGAQERHAGAEPNAGGVETVERVAGGHHHLSVACAGRQRQEGGRQQVEQGQAEGRMAFAGHGDEDLAAGTVGGQAARIAARVDDEDAQVAQHLGRRRAAAPFARHDARQAIERAGAAADAFAFEVRHHQGLPDAHQVAGFAPHGKLGLVGASLRIVRSREDQVVPKLRHARHGLCHDVLAAGGARHELVVDPGVGLLQAVAQAGCWAPSRGSFWMSVLSLLRPLTPLGALEVVAALRA